MSLLSTLDFHGCSFFQNPVTQRFSLACLLTHALISQAMENLKVSTSNKWDTSVYAKYFEAFSDGYNNNYKASEDETSNDKLMEQTLAYALLLFFPILLVVVLALSRGAS